MTGTFALRRVDHLLLVYSAVVLLLFMLIYYVDTLMSGLLSGTESRTELQKSLLEGSN